MYSFRIEQAIRAAAVLHKDQVRKGEMPYPYITHLVAVAFILHDYTEDEDVIVAALLHDTVEDTDYSLAELQEDFGGSVRDLVEALTEPSATNKKELTWKERKKAYLKQLRDAPDEAVLIMAADKAHNMRTVVEAYYDETDRFLKEFSGSLEERLEQYQDIANLVNRRFKDGIVHEFNHVFNEYKQFIQYAQAVDKSI